MIDARPSSVPETVHVVVADRLARAVVATFGLCEDCGAPLAERQKIALCTAALLEFDGVQAEIDGLRRVERLLDGIRDTDGRAPHFGEGA
jgi:hypothetical protein